MREEQSATISPASRWLKALKSRPTRVSGASAIAADTDSTGEGRGNRALSRAGTRQDRHVVVERVGGEGAQCALESLHRPGGIARSGKLRPQTILAKAPRL